MQHVTEPPPLLRRSMPTIPPMVEQVVMRALAKDPKQRFGSIQAFATALEQASRPTSATPFVLPTMIIPPNELLQPTEVNRPSSQVAQPTYAILKKAADNGDLTRDGAFTAFESLKNVDLGGLLPPVSYGSSPNDRVPSRDSVVYIIDPTQPTDIKPLSGDFTGTAAMQSQF